MAAELLREHNKDYLAAWRTYRLPFSGDLKNIQLLSPRISRIIVRIDSILPTLSFLLLRSLTLATRRQFWLDARLPSIWQDISLKVCQAYSMVDDDTPFFVRLIRIRAVYLWIRRLLEIANLGLRPFSGSRETGAFDLYVTDMMNAFDMVYSYGFRSEDNSLSATEESCSSTNSDIWNSDASEWGSLPDSAVKHEQLDVPEQFTHAQDDIDILAEQKPRKGKSTYRRRDPDVDVDLAYDSDR